MFRNTQKVFYKVGTQPPSKDMVKHPYKIHAWGAFSVKGPIGFFLFADIMNGALYRKILTENLFDNANTIMGKIGCSSRITIRSIKLRKPWNFLCNHAQR